MGWIAYSLASGRPFISTSTVGILQYALPAANLKNLLPSRKTRPQNEWQLGNRMSLKTTLEIIAPTVEEAIDRGLSPLGLSIDAVDVDILDQGSRGLLGWQPLARVRLTIKPPAPQVEQQPVEQAAEAQAPAAAEPKRETKPAQPAAEAQEEKSAASEATREALRVAQQVVTELLEKMKVRADVSATVVEPVDENDEELVMVEIRGEDLSILIGRRSETLNALQYIASLIVSKELGRWVPMSIDVQGYRARRERQIRILARRMAEQALHTGRKQTLEPMPANERRLVHLELRDHPGVYTESTGDEPNRKVVILLKKNTQNE